MKRMWLPPHWKRFLSLFVTSAGLLALMGSFVAGDPAALGSLYGSLVALIYVVLLVLSSGQMNSRKFRWWNIVLSLRFILTVILLLIGYKMAFLSFYWIVAAFFLQYPLFFFFFGWKAIKGGSDKKKGGE